jgi:hypothetical protein
MDNRNYGDLYFIAASKTASLSQGYWHTIKNTAAAAVTVDVKGGGIYEILAANGGNGTHYDTDGVTVLGAAHDAGAYESIPTNAVSITIGPGEEIYGRFTEIVTGAGEVVIAYK